MFLEFVMYLKMINLKIWRYILFCDLLDLFGDDLGYSMLKTIFGDDLGISPAVKSIFNVKTIKKGKKY